MLTFDTRLSMAVAAAINERIGDIGQMMSDGTLESFEHYKREAGRVMGLREALDILEDEAKKLKER